MTGFTQNTSLELLDSQAHRSIKIDTKKLNTKQNRVNVASVTVGELNVLVHEYAIFMTKNPTSDDLQLTALLGFKSGQNLYLEGDNWRVSSLPLDILRRPFQAYMPESGIFNKGHIAIDMLAEQVNLQTGTPLYDEQGNKADLLQRIEQTFAQLMGGAVQTAQLLKQAESLELVEKIDLKIEIPDKEEVGLTGLYAFNTENVAKLKGEALEQAHQSGLLQVIPLVLSSTIHIQKLIGWAQNA